MTEKTHTGEGTPEEHYHPAEEQDEPMPLELLPEAPASATARVRIGRFEWLFTMRDHDAGQLIRRMQNFEKSADKLGIEPAGSGGTAPAAASSGAPNCPTHGTPMKASKHGSGFFCPQKIADDDGTGKPVYCKQKAD